MSQGVDMKTTNNVKILIKKYKRNVLNQQIILSVPKILTTTAESNRVEVSVSEINEFV